MKVREAFALSKGKKPTKLFEVIEYILSHGGEAKSRDLAKLFSTPSVFYSSVSKAPGLERQGDTYRVSDALYEGYKVACSLVGKKPLPKDGFTVLGLLEEIRDTYRPWLSYDVYLDAEAAKVGFRHVPCSVLRKISTSLVRDLADYFQYEARDSSGTSYSDKELERTLNNYKYDFDVQDATQGDKPALKLVMYDPLHTWNGLEQLFSSTARVDASTKAEQVMGQF